MTQTILNRCFAYDPDGKMTRTISICCFAYDPDGKMTRTILNSERKRNSTCQLRVSYEVMKGTYEVK